MYVRTARHNRQTLRRGGKKKIFRSRNEAMDRALQALLTKLSAGEKTAGRQDQICSLEAAAGRH